MHREKEGLFLSQYALFMISINYALFLIAFCSMQWVMVADLETKFRGTLTILRVRIYSKGQILGRQGWRDWNYKWCWNEALEFTLFVMSLFLQIRNMENLAQRMKDDLQTCSRFSKHPHLLTKKFIELRLHKPVRLVHAYIHLNWYKHIQSLVYLTKYDVCTR